MFISSIPGHVFFAAGKTGTRTLLSIEGMTELSNSGSIKENAWTYVDPALALVTLEKHLLLQPSELHIIVRDPQRRLISGLFEIVAKKIVGPASGFKTLSNYYSETYWADIIQATVDVALPAVTAEHIERHPFWQFHIGNWLATARSAQKLGGKITDIGGLTALLTQLNLKHTVQNTSSSFANSQELFYPTLRRCFEMGFAQTECYSEFSKYIESDIKLYHSF